jgi:hypothetical protein
MTSAYIVLTTGRFNLSVAVSSPVSTPKSVFRSYIQIDGTRRASTLHCTSVGVCKHKRGANPPTPRRCRNRRRRDCDCDCTHLFASPHKAQRSAAFPPKSKRDVSGLSLSDPIVTTTTTSTAAKGALEAHASRSRSRRRPIHQSQHQPFLGRHVAQGAEAVCLCLSATPNDRNRATSQNAAVWHRQCGLAFCALCRLVLSGWLLAITASQHHTRRCVRNRKRPAAVSCCCGGAALLAEAAACPSPSIVCACACVCVCLLEPDDGTRVR